MDKEIREKTKHTWITIEPILGVIFLAAVVSDSVLTELYLKRTCEFQLSLNSSICVSLGTHSIESHEAEALVQPYATYYLKWKNVLQSILPSFLSLFLGPWSDQYGRRPILAFALTGAGVMYVLYAILSMVPNLHPGFILIGVLPLALMGGYVNMISACFCFMTDITTLENRLFRMSILETVIQTAQLVGLPLAGIIFSNTKTLKYPFAANFGLSGALCFSALIYLIFFVNESVNVRKDTTRKWANLFDLAYPKQVWRICTQPRPGNRRIIIFLCAFVLASFILILEGEAQIAFLFVRLQFGWDLEWFTKVSAIIIFVIAVGTVTGCKFLKILYNNSDACIALTAFLAVIIGNIFVASASPDQSYFMFIAGGFSALKGAVFPVFRSILSQTVPPKDLSKVYAFTFCCEAVQPIIAGPLYLSVYNSTLSTFPGAVYLVSVGIYVMNVVAVLTIVLIQRQFQKPSSEGGEELEKLPTGEGEKVVH